MKATPATTRHCGAALLLLALLAAPSASTAHSLGSPRLTQLRLSSELIEVAVQNALHSGTRARALRERFDVDVDGRIDPSERSAMEKHLDDEARASLRILVDGVLLAPQVGRRELDFGRDHTVDGGEGVALRSSAAVAVVLLPGPHELEVHDVPISPRVLLPLRLDLPADWVVEPSGATGSAVPLRRLPDGAWLGGWLGEGGAVSFRIVVPAGRPPGEASPP